MTHVQPGDRIAVTGATGFVGQTLVEHLATCGYQLVGLSESAEPHPRIAKYLAEYHSVDLVCGWPAIPNLKGIVHLAGLAAVGPSLDRPHEYITTNSAMVTHLFEHAVREGWGGRAVIVSSGAVYGGDGYDDGFTEDSPLFATSPYVVSKLLVERQTEYYRRRGIDVVVVRPFNHIGPGQLTGFIVPDLVTKVCEWQPGTALPVGNLNSARDYTDVRDIVAAYRTLLESPEPRYTTYNVCSGSKRSGWEILESVCASLGKPIPPTFGTDFRAIDPSVVLGNADRLMRETGWQPTIALQTSIDDFVASHRAPHEPIIDSLCQKQQAAFGDRLVRYSTAL